MKKTIENISNRPLRAPGESVRLQPGEVKKVDASPALDNMVKNGFFKYIEDQISGKEAPKVELPVEKEPEEIPVEEEKTEVDLPEEPGEIMAEEQPAEEVPEESSSKKKKKKKKYNEVND